MTEAEFQRAAFSTPGGSERRHPWGDEEPTDVHGVFDFTSWDPQPVGTHPAGSSAWGIDDLVGNGWEWTETAFGPFPGFRPMASYPEYSADFFDGEHFVMKGASPATARELLRPSFRNWFRARYPYVYATFRCVKGATDR
jgi:formylglycine-generating enzyme required for sulfatase activity